MVLVVNHAVLRPSTHTEFHLGALAIGSAHRHIANSFGLISIGNGLGAKLLVQANLYSAILQAVLCYSKWLIQSHLRVSQRAASSNSNHRLFRRVLSFKDCDLHCKSDKDNGPEFEKVLFKCAYLRQPRTGSKLNDDGLS